MKEKKQRRKNNEQSIIEIDANKKIMDINIYFDNEKFQIRRRKNKTCLQCRNKNKYCQR